MKNKKLIVGVIGGVAVLAAVGVYLDAKKVREAREEKIKKDEKETILLAEKRYEILLESIDKKYSRYCELYREYNANNKNAVRADIATSIDCTYKRRITKIKQCKERGEDADTLCLRLYELEEYLDMSFRNLTEMIMEHQ